MPARKYYVNEIAVRCGCSVAYIKKLEKEGDLPAARRLENKYRYYNEKELKKIIKYFETKKRKSEPTLIQGKLFDEF